MAEDTEKSGEAAKPQIAAPKSELNKDLKALPMVESPPLSPAGGEPSVTLEPKAEPISSPAGRRRGSAAARGRALARQAPA